MPARRTEANIIDVGTNIWQSECVWAGTTSGGTRWCETKRSRGSLWRRRRAGERWERFGTAPCIVLIDRWAFTRMITRLKFHRESIFTIVKTSRVQLGRMEDATSERIDEDTLFLCCCAWEMQKLSFLFVILTKTLIFYVFLVASNWNSCFSIILPESLKARIRKAGIYLLALYIEYTSEKFVAFNYDTRRHWLLGKSIFISIDIYFNLYQLRCKAYTLMPGFKIRYFST